MLRLRRLSGDEVVGIFLSYGFEVIAQRGSHVKLRRITEGEGAQVLTIPRHRQLDLGTIRAIFRQASRFIPEADLRKGFYAD